MKRPSPSRDRKALTDEADQYFKWPPFYEASDLKLIVHQIQKVALNDYERRVYMSILHRAFEDAIELEILYRELPKVLLDDHEAIRNFQMILDMIQLEEEPNVSTRMKILKNDGIKGLKPLPDLGGSSPCQPQFLIKPDRIFFITLGIERITGNNPRAYQRYINVLANIWYRTFYLDLLYRQAVGAITSIDKLDRLARTLRLFSCNARVIESSFTDGPKNDLSLIEFREVNTEHFSEFQGNPIPPIEGIEMEWPPTIGNHNIDILAFCHKEELCKGMVLDGLSNARVMPLSTFTGKIVSISPASVCFNQNVTISGSGFGNTKNPDIEILIGNVVAPIVSWADNKIVIMVPEKAQSGCVGFRDKKIEASRQDIYQINMEAMNQINEGLMCMGYYGAGTFLIPQYIPSSAQCTSSNFLSIGQPIIESFAVLPSEKVEPNTEIILVWELINTKIFSLRRISQDGPDVNITNPTGSTINIGPFIGTKATKAKYELVAENDCGITTKEIEVSLQTRPSLRILGIEVVQVIQHPDNTVRLVAQKETAFRVYVDSGITNGFDNGDGPNTQSFINGSITLFPAGTLQNIDIGPPRDPHLAMHFSSLADVNRDRLGQSMNFKPLLDILPLLSGPMLIEAKIWVNGHEKDLGGPWAATAQTTVNFIPKSQQELLPILISDTLLGLPAPTIIDYEFSLLGAKDRFPIAENGFIVNPPLTLATDIQIDLTKDDGWNILIAQLTTMIFLFPSTPVGGIRTGLVPNDQRYKWNGMAIPRIAISIPSFIAQTGELATFAHEMGHVFGIGHASCPAPGSPDAPSGLDSRLPVTTEDTGLLVRVWDSRISGSSEIMSYCGKENRWPSIIFWDVIFDSAPI